MLNIVLAALALTQVSSFESVDVCQKVPGATLAAAVGGRLVDQRSINVKGLDAARCVYGIEIDGSRRAFVVWANPAGDFDGLRAASTPPLTEVPGVGDEAFTVTDPETRRVQLTGWIRGKLTVQVSGERAAWVIAIAKTALSRF
ncbi:MAG TPA: hypothetical protein PLH72_01630 [Vicinamibacterales bacterium]|nr:hypothetical protein [Vicinamibacterales bacterium]